MDDERCVFCHAHGYLQPNGLYWTDEDRKVAQLTCWCKGTGSRLPLPRFWNALVAEQVSDNRDRLRARLIFFDEDGSRWEVPEGFETDYASVPRPLWALIPARGKHSRAAVLHDFRCWKKDAPHTEVHAQFLRALKACGVSWFVRRIMYRAVEQAGPVWQWPR